ncbi:ankyrin repeat-containing domain protein [Podospora fimiseda]|uniref:Ankyrin repeat-containing domain protein n=1 Tax=Podospora fimiseda TaxID=252190 RepID=A0AAN7GSI5_9PEZI|nr:ankyrin repeat-containing domain protein [Podospora fimiseda]
MSIRKKWNSLKRRVRGARDASGNESPARIEIKGGAGGLRDSKELSVEAMPLGGTCEGGAAQLVHGQHREVKKMEVMEEKGEEVKEDMEEAEDVEQEMEDEEDGLLIFMEARGLLFPGDDDEEVKEVTTANLVTAVKAAKENEEEVHSKVCIRLLHLLPHSDQKAPIECRLTVLPSLSTSEGCRPYEALSYVWGSPLTTKSIRVNGHFNLVVTENLYAALMCLRDQFIQRILWVDAVCINQSEQEGALKERSEQVQAMARIYAQASRVLVWLGEVADGSDQALDEICAAAEISWSKASLTVLQEVAAARSILIECGPAEVDGYAFCLGLIVLNRILVFLVTAHSVSVLMRGSIFRSRRITTVLNQYEEMERFSLNIRPLSELVNLYHTREATDLRDKVYELLGICTDDLSDKVGQGLSANYQFPWEKVFRQLIYFLLSDKISVKTWPGKKTDLMKYKGYVLGEISSVNEDKAWNWQDRRLITITRFEDKKGPSQGQDKIVRLLLKSGNIDLEQKDDYLSRMAIHWAAVEGHARVVETFLEDDRVDPNDRMYGGDTALHLAVYHGHTTVVKLLLNCDRVDTKAKNGEGCAALHVAILQEKTPVLKLPLDSGKAYPDTYFLYRPMTLNIKRHPFLAMQKISGLHLAAYTGNQEAINMLLETGKVDFSDIPRPIELSIYNVQQLTPLSCAAFGGHTKALEILLDIRKPNKNSRDWEDMLETALQIERSQRHDGIIKSLLENGKVRQEGM